MRKSDINWPRAFFNGQAPSELAYCLFLL